MFPLPPVFVVHGISLLFWRVASRLAVIHSTILSLVLQFPQHPKSFAAPSGQKVRVVVS